MKVLERQRALDSLLLNFRDLWHPQPFREIRPAWCERWPVLAKEVLALPEADVAHLNDDIASALALLSKHIPAVTEIAYMADLPVRHAVTLPELGSRWAWEIPGRKQQQIEAFAGAIGQGNKPVTDWCGGKGHLGRLLALAWRNPVHTLEIDTALCKAGESLARRAGVNQDFIVSDALTVADWPRAGHHAVALHACGELHRRLIHQGAETGVARFDVAPCCYYRGVAEHYQALSKNLQLILSRDDTRLAVTETVTSSPRETRQRDRAIAWKLGFDAYRRAVEGGVYHSFRPVPDSWIRADFADFLAMMASRESLPLPASGVTTEFESRGWQRRGEVMRLSVVRHAFRRAIEVWLALDLAAYLESKHYVVELGSFCERHLTPRNLLISARRA